MTRVLLRSPSGRVFLVEGAIRATSAQRCPLECAGYAIGPPARKQCRAPSESAPSALDRLQCVPARQPTQSSAQGRFVPQEVKLWAAY